MAKIKIELNSEEKLTALLQETYDLANGQIKAAQDELSKLDTSTDLKDLCVEEKSKYYKAVNDLLTIKDKAMGRKIEISKLMADVIKNNGDLNKALDENSNSGKKFDLSEIRKQLEAEAESGKLEIYKVK